jgi:osmotically-inducible protein OsmY
MFKQFFKSVTCLALLAAFVGCASTQKHETAGQYVDDSVITTRVKSAIYSEATLKTLQISVKTEQGVVRLSGYVDSAQSISKAGEVARGVSNVASVRNDLIVK